jgi:hypothetical protein
MLRAGGRPLPAPGRAEARDRGQSSVLSAPRRPGRVLVKLDPSRSAMACCHGGARLAPAGASTARPVRGCQGTGSSHHFRWSPTYGEWPVWPVDRRQWSSRYPVGLTFGTSGSGWRRRRLSAPSGRRDHPLRLASARASQPTGWGTGSSRCSGPPLPGALRDDDCPSTTRAPRDHGSRAASRSATLKFRKAFTASGQNCPLPPLWISPRASAIVDAFR